MTAENVINGIIEPLRANAQYDKVLAALASGKPPVMISGVFDSQKCHLIYAIGEHLRRPVFIITGSELKAKHIYEDMRFFAGERARLYPAKDAVFYSADAHSGDIMKKRFEIMDGLASGRDYAVVAPVCAPFDRLMKRESFGGSALTFKEGQTLDVTKTLEGLVSIGYERVITVEGAGQFSKRGGILDIYSIADEKPVRIELWDDEIDSVRTFDVLSQRSVDRIDEARVTPRVEMTDGAKAVTLLEYLPENTVIFFDEPGRVKDYAESAFAELAERIKTRMEKGVFTQEQIDAAAGLFGYYDILKACEKFSRCLLVNIASNVNDFEAVETFELQTKQVSIFKERFNLLAEDLLHYKQNGYTTLVLGGARSRCERLAREISDCGTDAYFIESPFETKLKAGTVAISAGSVHHGFEYPSEKFIVISDREIFGESKPKRKKRKKQEHTLESFTDLKPGDFVVHRSHGIGIFKGIVKTEIDGVIKDFIKIEYADGGMIGVSVNQLEMIQKYIGQEGYSPKLHKLGGGEWERAKTRVKAAAKELAKDLIALYRKRQAAVGHSFSKDTLWQTEFEDMFPFDETDDQLNAIEDVKNDMESNRVMDRLICGDVGYGKTEIAIRAAFKCAQDGKQVAYLVPTTILAQQHYNTFYERMKDYPVVVEMLSRFKTAAQQKKIIEGLKKGSVDIIIATHRIISKDIEFRDLGLVIIDEEQRFGVLHKEKLKKLRENVDVLTLTATPIPRTLHMSITGIRDLSLLEEPPLERRPIQTYVVEYDKQSIRDAINRELARDGQVYYLHNRVRNILEVGARLQRLVPEARVACAHGQMGERELETIMIDFINGDIDVLVCTTIIETGLDIPNVNTIIIQDADKMGLSQLYQLRGRVGRSHRLAYAYLCYRKDSMLSETAEKRLQTIKEFTEFGSGFKIAMRDLEIRGAGNLLGGEQHGHMEAVGYEMYCRLLGDAVREEKNEEVVSDFETQIDINVDAYIPPSYIESDTERLAVYKKVAQIAGYEDYLDVSEEIEDRYGNVPSQIRNLLEVALLKAYAHTLDVISVSEKNGNIVVTFKNDAQINLDALTEFIKRNSKTAFFTAAPNPYVTIRLSALKCRDKAAEAVQIKNMLHELKDLNFQAH